MRATASRRAADPSRRAFIGGSDARIIMDQDEEALRQLWREKRGEAEPDDLSSNLIVQLGIVTERLNRSSVRASGDYFGFAQIARARGRGLTFACAL
jgi:predicted phage-related endonuclease